uniref:26S proteasome regulatory subunit S3 n=1 Tax=Rhizophora mucronata TaxID=61149 RepID=A0A2P2KLU8_RHIMU
MAMNTAESLVTQIQGLSGSASDISALHDCLKQAEDSLRNDALRLVPLLNHLDPALHSLGYLYFLDACTSGAVPEDLVEELVLITARFITSCAAEQICLAPTKFIVVCKKFKEQAVLRAPIRGVAPLLAAVRKLQSSPEHLTTLHPDFLQLCLLAKCYKVGLTILKDDIFEVDQPRDLFLYCYYGWAPISPQCSLMFHLIIFLHLLI